MKYCTDINISGLYTTFSGLSFLAAGNELDVTLIISTKKSIVQSVDHFGKLLITGLTYSVESFHFILNKQQNDFYPSVVEEQKKNKYLN